MQYGMWGCQRGRHARAPAEFMLSESGNGVFCFSFSVGGHGCGNAGEVADVGAATLANVCVNAEEICSERFLARAIHVGFEHALQSSMVPQGLLAGWAGWFEFGLINLNAQLNKLVSENLRVRVGKEHCSGVRCVESSQQFSAGVWLNGDIKAGLGGMLRNRSVHKVVSGVSGKGS